MKTTVLCCLIWDADSSPWKLKVITNAIVSHAPPEKLTYEDERPSFGVARQALYDLLHIGFANEVEIDRYELTFTGLAPFNCVDSRLTRALYDVFGYPVTFMQPILGVQTVAVE